MTTETTDTPPQTAAVGAQVQRGVRRRWRAPKAAPGELVARWGKLPHENPQVCYSWGEGCTKREAALLHNVLTTERPDWTTKPLFSKMWPSFLAELEASGYDLTTLRFSVRKKQAPNTGIQRR